MKVIFLDIDGVMNTKVYRENPDVDYYEHPISEMHMCLLEYLVKTTGAKIVLTSTWREYWNKGKLQFDRFGAYINRLFAEYGLEIYDKTPEQHDRSEEIDAWISLYQGELESYVILDDFDFDWSQENEKHLVKTTDEVGFDEEAVEKAIKILNENEVRI